MGRELPPPPTTSAIIDSEGVGDVTGYGKIVRKRGNVDAVDRNVYVPLGGTRTVLQLLRSVSLPVATASRATASLLYDSTVCARLIRSMRPIYPDPTPTFFSNNCGHGGGRGYRFRTLWGVPDAPVGHKVIVPRNRIETGRSRSFRDRFRNVTLLEMA